MTPTAEGRIAARLGVLAAAVLFSTGGAAIKACALSGGQVAALRSGVAALVLLAAIPAARRGWNRRTLVVACAYAATLILFVRATKLTTAANAVFLQATAPLYVVLIAHWVLRERSRARDWVLMAAVATGLVLLYGGVTHPLSTAPDPVAGNILGTVSGIFWALTIVGLRWVGRGSTAGGDAAVAAAALGNLLAFAVSLPWVLPLGSLRVTDGLVIAYLGVAQVALPYFFLTRSLQRIAALEASLLLLLEPVLNPIWAWLVEGERPGVWALAGGGIILAATVANTLFESISPWRTGRTPRAVGRGSAAS